MNGKIDKMKLSNKHTGLNFRQLLPIGLCLGMSATSVNAALFDCASEPGICIGEGDSVIFKFAGTSSSLGLFGTVQVIGNNIISFPTEFRAESLNGEGLVSVNDNRTLEIIARPGYQIDGIKIVERGDYLISGSQSVDVDGLYNVWDWNDDPVFGTTDEQTLTVTGDLGIIDSNIHTWKGSANFDLSVPKWDGINHLGLGIQNNLYASTIAHGDIAWIEKKVAGVGFIVVPQTPAVPVPAAVWLFGSGLLALAGIARRQQKNRSLL